MQLNQLTITEAAKGLRSREFSSEELTRACLAAIRERDKDIHAFLKISDRATDAAKEADKLFKNDPDTAPPLTGIPLVIKDNILIEGEYCTAASRMLENYIASYDATVIRKLKNQHAVLLGKTNMDDSAMGSSTESSYFGPTKNPHDLRRVPGGSSGGSGAAVAADMCIAGLGSDTGGSIRQPASFCGIVGMKPTYGAVSRHGLIAMASSLDQIGPLTKTVADAEILFDAIRGQDGFDATVAPEDSFSDEPMPEKIRIGVPKEYFSDGLDPDVKDTITKLLAACEWAGAQLHEISLPHSSYALPGYYIIVPSEVSANLARLDGIRYGYHESKSMTLFDVYAQSRAAGFGPEIKRRIMLGTYALSAGYYDAYYTKAQQVRRLISDDFSDAFAKVDILIGPTTPTPAFLCGEKTNDPLKMYLADIYTVAINLAGLPGMSIPAGFVMRDGIKLPVGLQIIAPRFHEKQLFAIGKIIETLP
ncbi:MAG: Asp-tRNA(Asn)/Glu-tRNA(Gln) amidotransferase subunit GatA [Candidatus Sungbacteria bacterium]|nr:Asp-tRNA(Asn)/Glu-tRNA(Gln) amidotransferase subunit GatA [Candidatus Sungbacteria bacterium]